jgi:drug/metabolite transporter (DMT)-like permease
MAIVLGLAGVLIVIRPGTEGFNLKILIPFLQVFLFSVGVIFIKFLTKTESDVSIIFYPTIFNLIMCVFIVPFDWVTPKGINVILLVSIGILASIALLLKTKAYRIVPLSIVMPFEYTATLWAIFYDYTFYDKVLDIYSLCGIGIIIFTGAYLFKIEAQKKQVLNSQVTS